MKKILCLLLLLPNLLFSQESSSASKINLGVFVLPEMNHLYLYSTDWESSKAKLGFSAGVNVEFTLGNKVSLRAGLGYGFKRYIHILDDLVFGQDINPQQGTLSTSRLEQRVSFGEMQLPVIFQFKFSKHFFIAGGIEFNAAFANTSKREIKNDLGSIYALSDTQNKSSVNLAPSLSIGYVLPISNKSELVIEPMFKFYLLEYIFPSSNLYNYGIKFTYNFL